MTVKTIRSLRGGYVVHLIVDPVMDRPNPVHTTACGKNLLTPIIGSKYDTGKDVCPKCVVGVVDMVA